MQNYKVQVLIDHVTIDNNIVESVENFVSFLGSMVPHGDDIR